MYVLVLDGIEYRLQRGPQREQQGRRIFHRRRVPGR